MSITEIVLRLVGINATMLFFGFVYAYIIAKYPFRPRMTWLSVMVGDFVTDCGMAGQILLITENVLLACVPFLCHLLTGGPMILGQITKHNMQDGGSILIDLEDIDGD